MIRFPRFNTLSGVPAMSVKARAFRQICSSRIRHESQNAAGVGRNVIIAGAGFAGISTAMQLARRGASVTLVDPRPPLSATSQYSTECYRDFFADEALVGFMSRSVDIMEELAGETNDFSLNRRGYAFLAASDEGAESLEKFAETASSCGIGPVRRHSSPGNGTRAAKGYVPSPPSGFRYPTLAGIDILYGPEAILSAFPFVSKSTQLLLHARRCGWMDAQGLGQTMLNAGRIGAHGGSTTFARGSVKAFDRYWPSGEINRVWIEADDGHGGFQNIVLDCDAFVNAAGAWSNLVADLVTPGQNLPLENELHAKVVLNDEFGVIPQETSPFMVWRDPVTLDWDDEVGSALVEMDDSADGGILNSASWVGPQPGGQHLRPAGNGRVLLLWEHLHRHISLPPVPSMPCEGFLDFYPQLCIGGLQAMIPELVQYEDRIGRKSYVDGGYYTVTPDGRPLVSSHGPSNAFVCGGMGTYGFMGAPAAGELAALQVLGLDRPNYAGACEWPRKVSQSKPLELLDTSA